MMASEQSPITGDDEEPEESQDTPIQREPAWRVFAAEFNDARIETRGEGERAPSYVITPLGARINRMLAVGVLTSNEPTGDDGSMRRAQITDPTGVFHVYAGQYQPEALRALEELEPPQIVAVVGKARTYSPEEGTVYTSIRPEVIQGVDSEHRDAWILDTAEQSLERIQAMQTAHGLEEDLSETGLKQAGVPERLIPGVLEAMEAYPRTELASYLTLLSDALGYLLPAPPTPQIVHTGQGEPDQAPAEPTPSPGAPETTDDADASDASDEADVDAENLVFDLVEELDDGEGAPWEDIVAQGQDQGLTEESVEEAMNLLMDRGRVFEPVLGRLKAT